MFNMDNSTIAWEGTRYYGDYPLIMDKTSGKLYPIIVDGKPSEFDHDLSNESPF